MVFIAGSALNKPGIYIIYYTGNHRDNHWQRHAGQMIARLKEDGSVEKFPKPVIKQPEGYTSHFRDPKVLNMVREILCNHWRTKIMISKVDYYFIILKI